MNGFENVRKQSGKHLNELMNEFIDSKTNEDENLDWYTGKVIDNNDPDKTGKCKIRVFGVFGDEIPDNELPWAIPDFTFIGSTVGNFIVPPVNAIVKVYFDNGEVYLPHYTSKALTTNLPTQKDIDYPDNMVMWETDDNDYFTINRKSKETTFNHNSGTKILIKKDGSIEITGESKIDIKSTGAMVIESAETIDIKHTGILTVDGSTVTPTGKGPLCAIPFCLYTGSPHTGNDCLP